MAAKLIVTSTKGGSRIALVGASGTELLTSKVFSEPRGKGATLRALKGLLGEEIAVDDQTTNGVRRPATRVAVAPVRKTRRSTPKARVTTKPTARRRAPKSK
jgi:hypothetical protein